MGFALLAGESEAAYPAFSLFSKKNIFFSSNLGEGIAEGVEDPCSIAQYSTYVMTYIDIQLSKRKKKRLVGVPMRYNQCFREQVTIQY
jgi:hypothetical protein